MDPAQVQAGEVAAETGAPVPELAPTDVTPPPAPQPAQLEEPPAQPRRLAPARDDATPRRLAPAREAPAARPVPRAEETEGQEEHKAAPPARAHRTFAEKWQRAKTPEDRRKALEFALAKGVLTQADLDVLQGKAPEPARAPAPPPSPTAPAQAVAPAAPVAGTPEAAGPEPKPAEPLIHGQPASAVKAAAEKLHYAAEQLSAWGLMAGWGGAKPEPVKLFEGTEFEFECKGDPRKRLVELGAVELAGMQGSTTASPMGRRLELGMLALAAFGPGLVRPLTAVVGGVCGKLGMAARVVTNQVRRWRR